MKLHTVITATNDNPLYREYIPIFRKAWRRVFPDIKIIIILVDEKPDENHSPDIVHFKPVPGVHTAFQAQCIRLLWPALLVSEEGMGAGDAVLITDMDMIPMSGRYYTDTISGCDEHQFVCSRNVISHLSQYPVCYNFATPGTWKEIFNIGSEEDIRKVLKDWYKRANYDGRHGGSGWNYDQLKLFDTINAWRDQAHIDDSRLVLLSDQETGFKRLDRMHAAEIIAYLGKVLELTMSGAFSDFHMLRPYHEYEDVLEKILDQIPG